MAETMYERLGGMPAIRRMVTTFYDKIGASPGLARYFKKIDMEKLIDHQTYFFAGVSGSPIKFDDSSLWNAHAPLRISAAEFVDIAKLLTSTLEEHGVSATDIAEIIAAVAAKQALIVNDAGPPAAG